jgi:hypothetical protein
MNLPKDNDYVEMRMRELMEPVERQLMMCDNAEDQMMMTCAMLQRCFEVLDLHIGEKAADAMLLSHVSERQTERLIRNKYGDRKD